jgi:hypothetical protein
VGKIGGPEEDEDKVQPEEDSVMRIVKTGTPDHEGRD